VLDVCDGQCHEVVIIALPWPLLCVEPLETCSESFMSHMVQDTGTQWSDGELQMPVMRMPYVRGNFLFAWEV